MNIGHYHQRKTLKLVSNRILCAHSFIFVHCLFWYKSIKLRILILNTISTIVFARAMTPTGNCDRLSEFIRNAIVVSWSDWNEEKKIDFYSGTISNDSVIVLGWISCALHWQQQVTYYRNWCFRHSNKLLVISIDFLWHCHYIRRYWFSFGFRYSD